MGNERKFARSGLFPRAIPRLTLFAVILNLRIFDFCFGSCGRAILVGVLLLVIAAAPGCSGCRGTSVAAKNKKKLDDEANEKKKKKLEKPKPDFELTKLKTFPDDPSTITNYVKPGHWISARQRFLTNNFDFSGDVESSTVDSNGKQLDVDRTPFQISGSRKIQLPKGSPKDAELLYHVPRRTATQTGSTKSVWLRTRLLTARNGREVTSPTSEGTMAMPDYQFYLVVLAKDPDSYGYLKKLESIAAPRYDYDQPLRTYYRVILPPLDLASETAIPLSENPITWTTVAYLWWDDVQPSSLSVGQQQALLDWLHWGGQMVISGPNSLDVLKNSFLTEYLPAEKVQSREVHASDMTELDESWSLFCKRTNDARRLDLVGQPLLGAELRKHAQADFIPGTSNLMIERRVGQGRIVVSAVPLNDRRIVNWRSFDNFVNACLLRRPSRKYSTFENDTIVHQGWSNFEGWLDEDPRLASTVRYFTRDVGYLEEKKEQELFHSLDSQQRIEQESQRFGGLSRADASYLKPKAGHHPFNDDWHFDGYSYSPESGVGGWNDFSAVADQTRKSLTRAAGIKIPRPDFVLKVVGIYLLVLVPVNWLVFRLLGRVEWAWIAAPIIAIAGAVMVIRTAQLDIGFIRSRTEIAVLEIQGGFPRAHLTRFTALYSSLATAYDLGFEDPSAVALPFASDPTYRRELNESAINVHFRNETRLVDDQKRLAGELSGFQVSSNSTSMIHSEQMIGIGGSLRLIGDEDQGFQLTNDSELALKGVGVLRVAQSGQKLMAWIGDLDPQTTQRVRFEIVPDGWQYFSEWNKSPATVHSEDDLGGEINLAGLIDLAIHKIRMRRGDARLVGWSETDFSGQRLHPRTAQTNFRALVVGHLTKGTLPAPQPDTNCSMEFRDPPADDAETELTPPSETSKGGAP